MQLDYTSKKFEIIALLAIILFTLLTYSNHFNNPFFFDDSHTITENESIRSLTNWTRFFTDANTFSSLPANRSYRPLITLKNAVDYALADGLNPSYFHYHIFVWYSVLIMLLYFLAKQLFKQVQPKKNWVVGTALVSASWFALHTVNAETINYICARSDSFTTLCIVAALLLFIYKKTRRWHLYLLPMVLGIWTKQTGVMFFPILVVYVLLFEESALFTNFKKDTKKNTLSVLKKIAPAGILACSLFIFNQYYLTPRVTISTNYTVTRFEYISTQLYVMMTYLGNFIVPNNLSADPDLAIIKPWYDTRILSGAIVCLALILTMIKTAFSNHLKPIAFGIAWFFIALLPTTLNPLFQISNDHRMFFPFVGLFIAVPWAISQIIRHFKVLDKNRNYRYILGFLIIATLSAHAIGTRQRNKIWHSPESLWLDVSIKSPKNARGLMNYGETQMRKGNYTVAAEYFEKALKIKHNYYSLHINLGILNAAQNKHIEAQQFFEKAIDLQFSSPDPEYFYARYLNKQKDYKNAEKYLKLAIKKSNNHLLSKQLLSEVSKHIKTPEQEITELIHQIKNNPTIENYINLSLKYYEIKEYKKVLLNSQKALEIAPNSALVYNNMCAAYNQLQQWELGVKACQKALALNPSLQIAKNNLKWATSSLEKIANQK